MTFLIALMLNLPAAHANNCFDPQRLANTKAALIYYFTHMNTHACKKPGTSEIFLSHAIEKEGAKDWIDFFIKCDQEYPVIGKIQWFEPTCSSAAIPAAFSSAELVK